MPFLTIGMEQLIDIGIPALRILVVTAPVWLPLLLLGFAWRIWVDYVQLRTISKKDFVLLEIILPQDVDVSPLAMEVILNVLHDRGSSPTWWLKWVEGKIFPWWSFEIASFGGNVHFYVWTEEQFRHLFEAQFYAQFPDIEIVEVEDYTQQIEYDEDKHSMWANNWQFMKPDPYPIKTYVDYGLDKDPKEELKIDPITAMLEFMASLQPGEQIWTQFVIRYHHNKLKRKKGTLFQKVDPWEEEAHAEIEKIKKGATLVEDDSEGPSRLVLTPGQRDTIAAIERSLGKLPFEVGIRTIYLADQDKFRTANISGLVGSMRQYNSNDLNGFRPTYSTEMNHPWEDFRGMRSAYIKRNQFDAYRRRSFFYPPHRRKTLILNTEELATIFHFPGRVATTPTLKRIASRKAVPPSDLPI